MGDEEKTKKLNLMRYAMFVTFTVVFAVLITLSGFWGSFLAGDMLAVFKQFNFWLALAADLLLCWGAFKAYEAFLNRK